jgi:hypothetical protein
VPDRVVDTLADMVVDRVVGMFVDMVELPVLYL